MKKITVPTDFSKNSKQALVFAEDMAVHLFPEEAQIDLIHFYYGFLNTQKPLIIREGMTAEATVLRELEQFIDYDEEDAKQVFTRKRVNVVPKPAVGVPDRQLIKLSKEGNINLIVMGTAGENNINIERRIFGSTSTAVALDANCPVLVIPPEARYVGFKNILVAAGHTAPSMSDLNILKELTKDINPHYHFVNVVTGEGESFIPAMQVFESQVSNEFSLEGKTTIRQIEASTVGVGLETYAMENKIDLVVITTKRKGFLAKLLHDSQAQDTIIHSTLPILILHD